MCTLLYAVSTCVGGMLVKRWRTSLGTAGGNPPTRRPIILHKVLYWLLITVIVSMYAQRTIERNPDWKDDATLHLSSLNVCPRSAKLQLQVSKLKINQGHFKEAEQHLSLAREIDPDFCDIWYQEALMNIAYYHDIDGAIEKLSDSLHCIFTSTGTCRSTVRRGM